MCKKWSISCQKQVMPQWQKTCHPIWQWLISAPNLFQPNPHYFLYTDSTAKFLDLSDFHSERLICCTFIDWLYPVLHPTPLWPSTINLFRMKIKSCKKFFFSSLKKLVKRYDFLFFTKKKFLFKLKKKFLQISASNF